MRRVRKILKRKIRDIRKISDLNEDIRNRVARISYSQEGEDVIISSIFDRVRKGFYVDVGAHHPKRFSNTYAFYQRGWAGINIDPTPGCMALFERMRPRDINLEVGVALGSGSKRLFMFEEGALNTFDPELAEERREAGWPFLRQVSVWTRPLSSILREHCREPLQFMSVDAEGFDLEVLKSNDWESYCPRVVCVEALGRDEDPTNNWLLGRGYRLVAMTGRSRIYESS